jgi:hypothetical protein
MRGIHADSQHLRARLLKLRETILVRAQLMLSARCPGARKERQNNLFLAEVFAQAHYRPCLIGQFKRWRRFADSPPRQVLAPAPGAAKSLTVIFPSGAPSGYKRPRRRWD